MKNAAKIDLNMKDIDGNTSFHLACSWTHSRTIELGKIKIVDMMIEQSESLELDLKAVDRHGKTGYQFANVRQNTAVVNLIQTKMPSLAV